MCIVRTSEIDLKQRDGADIAESIQKGEQWVLARIFQKQVYDN